MVAAIRQSTTAIEAPTETEITIGPLASDPLVGSLLLLIAGQDGVHTQSAPAGDGWTKVAQHNTAGQSIAFFLKEATAGDTGAKTPTSDAADDWWAIYAELTGVSTSTTPDAIASTNETSGNTGNFPAVTPTVDDCIILLIGGTDQLIFGATAPTNYTVEQVADEGSVSGCLGFRVLSGGGSVEEDPGNWTLTGTSNDKTLVTAAIAPAAGGATPVSPADAAHGHAGENATIAQTHVLAVDDASHAHAADNAVVVEAKTVAPDAALHGHAADNAVLPQTHVLPVQDAAHAHAAENATVLVGGALAPADAVHGHTGENAVIDQTHALAVDDALHGHVADNVVVDVQAVVSPDSALHGHAAENAGLDAAVQLAPDDAAHAHAAENATVPQTVVLAVQDAAHAHAAESAVIDQIHDLVVGNATHGHTADNVTVFEIGTETSPARIVTVAEQSRTVTAAAGDRTLIA